VREGGNGKFRRCLRKRNCERGFILPQVIACLLSFYSSLLHVDLTELRFSLKRAWRVCKTGNSGDFSLMSPRIPFCSSGSLAPCGSPRSVHLRRNGASHCDDEWRLFIPHIYCNPTTHQDVVTRTVTCREQYQMYFHLHPIPQTQTKPHQKYFWHSRRSSSSYACSYLTYGDDRVSFRPRIVADRTPQRTFTCMWLVSSHITLRLVETVCPCLLTFLGPPPWGVSCRFKLRFSCRLSLSTSAHSLESVWFVSSHAPVHGPAFGPPRPTQLLVGP